MSNRKLGWLHTDEWRFLTNLSPTYIEYGETRTREDFIDGIKKKYGDENVKVEAVAYDVNRKVIPGYVAVFVKNSAFNEKLGLDKRGGTV